MAIDAYKPKLGEEGERCASCAVPLAEDQRYCLNCGTRRGNARIPFIDVMRSQWEAERERERAVGEEEVAVVAAENPERNWTPLIAAAGGGLVALVLGLGFLIGQGGDDRPAASRPQVIQVGSGGAAPLAATTFQSDWPEGQEGYTVQLVSLPKAATQPAQVATAKTDAQGKGAADVGALDSDQHQGLDPGAYIVYSGVHDDEQSAKKALNKVRKDFPDAKVIQVGAGSEDGGGELSGSGGDKDALSGKKEATVDRGQLNRLQGLSPEEYQKQSRKLPETTILPGKPPPKDSKAPGGGSGAEVIP